jgi:hypothetical protein
MGNFKLALLATVGFFVLGFVMLALYSAWHNPSAFFDYLLFYLLLLPTLFYGLLGNILFLSTLGLVSLIVVLVLADRSEKRA